MGHLDRSRLADRLVIGSGYARPQEDSMEILGTVVVDLFDEYGNLKQHVEVNNLITQRGDEFYVDRAVGIGSVPTAKGMQVGTGSTAPAKTGAGAAIVTHVAGSNKAFDGSFPAVSLEAGKRRARFRVTWAAGEATADNIQEVTLGCPSTLGTAAWAAGDTVSRAIWTPVVNKTANDTLIITWDHEMAGV